MGRGVFGSDAFLVFSARRRKRKPRQKLERTLEKRCRAYARKKKWLLRKMNGLGFRSWCDRLLIPPPSKGVEQPVLWIEFKRKNKEPTVSQEHHHLELRLRGQHVHVVDDFDDFVRILKEFNK